MQRTVGVVNLANLERVNDPDGFVFYLIYSDFSKGSIAFDAVELCELVAMLGASNETILADALKQQREEKDAEDEQEI